MATTRDFQPVLPDWLHRRAADVPNNVALESPDQRLTYAELLQAATGLASKLRDVGLVPGDTVALLCKKGLVFAVGLHGVMQARAVAVPLNVRLTTAELSWQLRDAGVKAIAHDNFFADVAHRLQEELGARVVALNLESVQADGRTHTERLHIDLGETLAIMYTSGTTGHPKGAIITYGNQWWSAINSALLLGLQKGDRWLAPMPLFHMGGLSVLMRSLIYGTTAVIHDKFHPDVVNRTIDEQHINLVSVVPVMLQRMLEGRTRPYPEQLRCVLLGGSAAPKALLEQCQALQVPVAQSYGLTEANSQVTTLRPEEGLRKLGSSGKPLPATEVAIWVDGKPVGAHVPGEIVVRGPTIVPGYFHRPDATAAAMENGWFKTGDIGYIDEEGYLYVLDRRNDLIVSGGENVYPAEVESVLSTHPGVIEAGVTGREDATWGQVPVAFIKAVSPGPDLSAELEEHCRKYLAGYKVPKAFFFVDDLPRNASGKLMRRKLREWLTHTLQQS